jgi:putative transcriptional regulator
MPGVRTNATTVALAWTLLIATGLVVHAGSGSPTSAGPVAVTEQSRPDDPIGALAVGSVLVATRRVGDPLFAQSVVLLFAYSENGAAGLILNRPTTVPVDRVLPDLAVPRTAASRVFLGGPVSTADMRALLRAPVASGNARQLLPGVHLLVNRAAVDAAAAEGVTAEQLRVFAGYAGWSPGQLEREIRRGDWHVFDADGDVVFDAEPETLWERQIRLTEALAV